MITSSRSLQVLLGVIIFLLAANLLVQINPTGGRTAWGQGIPDSGAQLQAQIEQLKELNNRVDKLQGYLESGNLSVKVKDAGKSEK